SRKSLVAAWYCFVFPFMGSSSWLHESVVVDDAPLRQRELVSQRAGSGNVEAHGMIEGMLKGGGTVSKVSNLLYKSNEAPRFQGKQGFPAAKPLPTLVVAPGFVQVSLCAGLPHRA